MGRIGIFEMMPISEDIQKAILSGCDESEILKIALKDGMVTLRKSGLSKVRQGITSLDEIISITNSIVQ